VLGGDKAAWDIDDWNLRRDLLRWLADGVRVRLVLTEATASQLEEGVVNALSALAESSWAEVFLASVLPDFPSAELVAVVKGPSFEAVWASVKGAASTPGPGWGVPEAEGILVRGNELRPEHTVTGQVIEASSLRRVPEGTSYRVDIGAKLDGDIRLFGSFFWDVLNERLPEVLRFTSGIAEASRVTYSDRYLRSPLSVRLLFEALVGLKDLGLVDASCTNIEIVTSYPRSHGSTQWFNHDWLDPNQSKWVLEELCSGIGASARMRHRTYRDIPHSRTMTVHLPDRQVIIDLDQGFGCWRTERQRVFDFEASVDRQVETIRNTRFRVVTNPGMATRVYVGTSTTA